MAAQPGLVPGPDLGSDSLAGHVPIVRQEHRVALRRAVPGRAQRARQARTAFQGVQAALQAAAQQFVLRLRAPCAQAVANLRAKIIGLFQENWQQLFIHIVPGCMLAHAAYVFQRKRRRFASACCRLGCQLRQLLERFDERVVGGEC